MADRYSGTSRRESESCNFHCSNPSFSSTLLDAICRSIDQGEEEILDYGETMMRKKESVINSAHVRADHVFRSEEEIANFQRACMIEKWMEKKVGEKVAVRRKSMAPAGLVVKKSFKDGEEISSSSSCDSSCGGGSGSGSTGFFSSSDAESFRGKRPKPIRVGDLGMENEKLGRHEKPSKNQDGFLKTKSRALKIYGDLKKVKQPISPGARLAGFLNSLFTGTGNQRKQPKTSPSEIPSPLTKSANASTCSSASSFSRSCLSKTPSSRGKPTATEKRSVRFSPVSVIVDEDCHPPRGHKSLHEEINSTHKKHNLEAINEEIMVQVLEKNRRGEEAARDLLRNYQHKLDREFPFDFPDSRIKNQRFDREFEQEDEEDDDDAASYASSDLFELDNLSTIGMERYMEELPVYETTHLHSNRPIANRLIL